MRLFSTNMSFILGNFFDIDPVNRTVNCDCVPRDAQQMQVDRDYVRQMNIFDTLETIITLTLILCIGKYMFVRNVNYIAKIFLNSTWLLPKYF